jgi:hypothetical protein
MGTVMVNDYTISTSADADTAAALLGKAWTANSLRARIGRIEDLGNHTYRLAASLSGEFDVGISAEGDSTVISTAARKSRITQTKLLLLIPLSPKKVHVNLLTRNVIEKLLQQYLAEEGYDVLMDMHSHPLKK